MRCQKWQRIPGPGGLLRCKQFEYPERRGQMGFKPGHIPDNYGATCVKRKRVYSPWYDKQVWRCAKFGPGRARPRRARLSPGLTPRRAPSRRLLLGPGGDRKTPLLPAAPLLTPPPGRIPLTYAALEKRVAGRTPNPKPQQLTFGRTMYRRRKRKGRKPKQLPLF